MSEPISTTLGAVGAHRLIFVRGMGESWPTFVSVDHYHHIARFIPAAKSASP